MYSYIPTQENPRARQKTNLMFSVAVRAFTTVKVCRIHRIVGYADHEKWWMAKAMKSLWCVTSSYALFTVFCEIRCYVNHFVTNPRVSTVPAGNHQGAIWGCQRGNRGVHLPRNPNQHWRGGCTLSYPWWHRAALRWRRTNVKVITPRWPYCNVLLYHRYTKTLQH